MKMYIRFLLPCLLVGFLCCSCSMIRLGQNNVNTEQIRFMPFCGARWFADGVYQIQLIFRIGSEPEQRLALKAFHTNDGNRTLQSLQIQDGRKWRTLKNDAELNKVRSVLAAACKSESFRYYEIAQEFMLEQLHIYHAIRAEEALQEASAAGTNSLPANQCDHLKEQQRFVDDFSYYYRAYLYDEPWQNIPNIAHRMLDFLKTMKF